MRDIRTPAQQFPAGCGRLGSMSCITALRGAVGCEVPYLNRQSRVVAAHLKVIDLRILKSERVDSTFVRRARIDA